MSGPRQQTYNPLTRIEKPPLRAILIAVCVVALVAFIGLPYILGLSPESGLPSEDAYAASSVQVENGQTQDETEEPEDGQIEAGSIVIIREGAVYGGLASSRGKAVPKSQLSPTTHTVKRIETHHEAQEALLTEINSWVALQYLYIAIP